MRRQLGALLVLLVAAPAGGLNMLDGVRKLLLKRDSAFLYQEKALFMPGANARTEAAAKTACASGDRAAILRAVDDLEAVCVADDFLDTDAAPDGALDAFLISVDAGLEPSAAVLFGGDGEDAALDVAVGNDGALAVIGYSSGSLSLSSDHAPLGEEDLFVGVWDGAWRASGRFGGPAEDVGRAIDWHPSGDLVVGGSSYGSIDIGGASLAGYGGV